MTKPVPVISRWERFKRLTVWHPINTDPDDDDKWTVRVWLPAYDLLAVLAGIAAYTVGSLLLIRLFPPLVIDAAAVTFGLLGLVTLVGVTIPNLFKLEIVGKIGMSFMLTTYAFLVLAFPSQDQNNAFVTIILIMATWGIYPRLTKLFLRLVRQQRARELAKAAR